MLRCSQTCNSICVFRVKVVICGAIATVLTGIILRKIYLRRKQERIERQLKQSLERSRKERRQRARGYPSQLTDEQKCVVCVENPKEVNCIICQVLKDFFFLNKCFLFKVICLPCGHVCICEDCSAKIKVSCPVCRAKIDNKAAAFIS